MQRPVFARVLAAVVAVAGAARAASPGSIAFTPTASTDLVALEALVRSRAPTLAGERLAADLAAAELRQSLLLENPTLDLAANTIPVGETNPPGHPRIDVPNFAFGLSYHLEPGRRGPRQARARALLRRAQLDLDWVSRLEALRLARVLGALAVATLRLDGAQSLLEQARGSVQIAKDRLAAGFGTSLDVDRTEIDLYRIEELVMNDEGEQHAQLAACAALVAGPCAPFSDAGEARRFLLAWISGPALDGAAGPLDARADLRAYEAEGLAARHELRLAEAFAIPDPTLRFGYTWDRFVISGNQTHSLSLGLTLPLPLFDHGQAAADAARAKAAQARTARDLTAAGALDRIGALRRSVGLQRRRQEHLSARMIPRARTVVAEVERAAAARALAISDVIQARRTLSELMLAEADSLADGFSAALDLVAELPAGNP